MKLTVFLMVVVLVSSCSFFHNKNDTKRFPASEWQNVISCFDDASGTGLRIDKTNCHRNGTYRDRVDCTWQAVVVGKKVIDHMRGNDVFFAAGAGDDAHEYVISSLHDSGNVVFTGYMSGWGKEFKYLIKPEKANSRDMVLEGRNDVGRRKANWVFRACEFH